MQTALIGMQAAYAGEYLNLELLAMFVGIIADTLMARVGPQGYAEALVHKHVREMDFTGKPMRGYVYVDPAGFESDAALEQWVGRCQTFVRALPPK